MTTIINTPPNTTNATESDNSAGWAVAVIVLLAVIGGGIYLWFNYRATPEGNKGETNINVTLPVDTSDPSSGN